MKKMEITDQQLANFWSKVHKTKTCWNWTAGTSRGYGTFYINSKPAGAHRVAYQLEVDIIPDGMWIDHICHNRACVNPDHLRVVTAKQNMEHLSGARKNASESGVRGVTWAKDRLKWRADMCHNYKKMNLGYFKTIAEAEAAVIAKRNELYTHNDLDRKTA